MSSVMLASTIFLIVITCGVCTPIGEVDGEERMNWNSESVDTLRRNSYKHSPSEFLQIFSPNNQTDDEYVIFHGLYLKAFSEEPKPNPTFTGDKLVEMSDEFHLSKCLKPRMKMIDLYDELAIPPNIVISPPAVNLNRCGSNSGCCPKGESCDSTGQNFKSKTIMVLYIDGTNNDITVKRYNVTEHEKCHCRATTPDSSCATPTDVVRTSPSACDKKCISYFQQDNNCQCNQCSEGKHTRCLKWKRGDRSLTSDQARCVEEGKCVTPICDAGLYYSPSHRMCIELQL
ncbi:uncharacterized protein LOC117119477 isoform X2 [Anneissia japonica]|uniref:uncharacterized protein LOC117119477 isoform X2 n=1 Tax=Anneissia japonica TaxID=1529436 RepID=UPI001425A1AB|nr:uncharacterized protein LOC117119477 isoform X2 [Anneissia japonica]